ncbi:exodeoxyribonuclease III [Cupriavidus sp. TA19]|uniref:exodeoxyribonuclease III n=1 Tax=unclassified Cupriavidus TaxID=2640874 RepID=UPI000EC95C49|nr:MULTISPECIES: exodeoxyribonuclease III [unclassified Cupriavidus]BDB23845.1 exodeoxyribonuclease III [Cupriavidus sp. P-10]GLC93384.1 exodeoxyribonuclease III [Cupriavidus sp. TA19]
MSAVALPTSGPLRIASWNVNSLKVRLPQVLQWLAEQDQAGAPIDALCLQELKLPDDKYPLAELENAGFHSIYTGQKTYNGVAIVARDASMPGPADVVRNIPGFEDAQQRVIAATYGDLRLVCAYFPNGQSPESEKFTYKLKWLEAMTAWLREEMQRHPRLALLGDFNIAPEDRDVHDPAKWVGQNLVSPPERAAFTALVELGLADAFRRFEQPEKSFSWWDYRMMAFRRNAGLRIDHILLSPALVEQCSACAIDRVPRTWEQPSDHTPVVATLHCG